MRIPASSAVVPNSPRMPSARRGLVEAVLRQPAREENVDHRLRGLLPAAGHRPQRAEVFDAELEEPDGPGLQAVRRESVGWERRMAGLAGGECV